MLKEYNLSVEDLGVQRSAQAAAAQNPSGDVAAWNHQISCFAGRRRALIIVDQAVLFGAVLRFLLYLFFFRGGGRGGGFGGGGFGGGSYGGGSRQRAFQLRGW